MMTITFRCLLKLIFHGPEMIDTPTGKVYVAFRWRDPIREGGSGPLPGGITGDGCYYIEIKEPKP